MTVFDFFQNPSASGAGMAAGLRLLGDARRDDRRHRRHGAVYRPSPTGGKRAGRRPRRRRSPPLPPRRPQPRRRCRRSRPSAFRPLWARFAPFPAGCFAASPAQPVLWPSLDCWQAHPAVDLGAASGETAVCMRDGVVLSCVRDDLWGWHVAVRRTDGAVCTYSGLSCALVQAGRVVRGQPLGDVIAAVPAESELGAHLHLPLSRRRGSRTHAARLIFPNFQILPIHRKELSKYIK